MVRLVEGRGKRRILILTTTTTTMVVLVLVLVLCSLHTLPGGRTGRHDAERERVHGRCLQSSTNGAVAIELEAEGMEDPIMALCLFHWLCLCQTGSLAARPSRVECCAAGAAPWIGPLVAWEHGCD